MACFAVIALAPSAGFAQTAPSRSAKEQALERLAIGQRFYDLRDFERAIAEWKAGALLDNLPAFSYNLGQAYRQMGHYEEAIWHYERYLPRASNADRKRDVERFIKEMRAELERRAQSTPPIETLQNTENHPPRPAEPPPPAPISVVGQDEAWYTDPLGWGLAGAGGIGLGVSVGLLINAKSIDDKANSEPSIELRDSLHERASDRRLAGIIIGAVGVGALATGIVTLAIYPEDRPGRGAAIGLTKNGLMVSGRF